MHIWPRCCSFCWLLTQGVSVVLSVTSNSVLRETLAKKKGTILFPMGHLSLLDKKEIVQKELAVYGKKLSGAAFNNQVRSDIMCIMLVCWHLCFSLPFSTASFFYFLFLHTVADPVDEERIHQSVIPASRLWGAAELRCLWKGQSSKGSGVTWPFMICTPPEAE